MEVTKDCSRCNRNLTLDNFASHVKRGLQTYCKDCQKEYRRKHYEENKAKYIAKASQWNKDFAQWWRDYKSDLECKTCGENHPACLQFHHTHDDKEGNVAQFIQQGNKTKALAEIKKCEVLCANCHFKLHDSMRVSYNGNTTDFHSVNAGSTPATRS